MTNVKTMFGAGVWMAVATLLMLATMEPVTTDAVELAAAPVAAARG